MNSGKMMELKEINFCKLYKIIQVQYLGCLQQEIMRTILISHSLMTNLDSPPIKIMKITILVAILVSYILLM